MQKRWKSEKPRFALHLTAQEWRFKFGDDLWFLVVAQLQVFVLELLVLFCDLKDYNLVFSIQKVYSTPDGANISLNSTPVLISVAKQWVVLLPHSTNLFISHRNRLSGFEYRRPVWCSISFTMLNVERPVRVCVCVCVCVMVAGGGKRCRWFLGVVCCDRFSGTYVLDMLMVLKRDFMFFIRFNILLNVFSSFVFKPFWKMFSG